MVGSVLLWVWVCVMFFLLGFSCKTAHSRWELQIPRSVYAPELGVNVMVSFLWPLFAFFLILGFLWKSLSSSE